MGNGKLFYSYYFDLLVVLGEIEHHHWDWKRIGRQCDRDFVTVRDHRIQKRHILHFLPSYCLIIGEIVAPVMEFIASSRYWRLFSSCYWFQLISDKLDLATGIGIRFISKCIHRATR